MGGTRKLKMSLVISVFLLAMGPSIAVGDVIYVDDDASLGGNGQSWGTAYKYLQDALADANSGDLIWVAKGTYYPDEDEGGNVDPNDRTETFQLKNGVEIYGGFAGGESSLDERDWETNETILSGDLDGNDDGFTNNGENSYHVVTGSGTNGTAVLDGFTIEGGNANRPYTKHVSGGGMYNYGSSSPTLTNCTFSGNSAEENGGGMHNDESSPTLTNCTFRGNSANRGGGMYNVTYSSPTLTNCTFSGNSANYGGGMYNAGSNPALNNCTFSGNSANDYGGGMYNPASSPPLTNCILWGNSDIGGTDESAQMHGGTEQVWFSCIQDDDPNDSYIPFDGTNSGNIDDDPVFVREPNDGGDGWGVGDNDDFGDLHLQVGSPCINAGAPNFWLEPNSVDIDGQPRVFDGCIDIGADEFVVPMVTVTRPKGGEVWAAGSRHEINWFSYGVSGTVDIRLSKDAGSNWQTIESSVSDTGSYIWHLPDIVDSNQCLVLAVPSVPDPNVICVASGVFTIQPYLSHPQVESKWKSLGGDFDRAGLSDSNGPELACVKWQLTTDGAVSAGVTIGVDDRVHIACEDGIVYTVDANGLLLWSYDVNSPLISSPTIGPDGSVYVGSQEGTLYAIDINGSLRWTHTTGGPIYSSPAVSPDSNDVYVCSADGKLYALGQDGSELWSSETNGPAQLSGSIFASPAIGTDGTIYIAGLYDPNLYALDPNAPDPSDRLKWTCNFESRGWPFVSPVVAADGTIYQTLLYDPNLYAITPNEPNAGTIIWSVDLADPCSGWFDPDYAEECADGDAWSEPALGLDGTIYVSFDDPYLRAVDPNGSIKWVTRLGMIGGLTLTVGNDGLIYAAGDDGGLCVVDANGSEIARFRSDGALSFPVVAADNTIIVSDANNTVWAIAQDGCEGKPGRLNRMTDLNGDRRVDLLDLATVAADWLGCTAYWDCGYLGSEIYLSGDINRDMYVDFGDFAVMANRWLSEE